MRHRWIFAALPFLLLARSNADETPKYQAWLTGPLIAPTGSVTPAGRIDFEPYLYVTVNTGAYDSKGGAHSLPNFYSISSQAEGIFGLTSWLDVEILTDIVYNTTQGASSFNLGDQLLEFDFKLYSPYNAGWYPGVKLSLSETFPTGKYQKLTPRHKLTDSTGLGSFQTTANLVFYKIYHIHAHHFLSATFDLQYNVPAPVHVKGLNAYGGGPGTSGTVYPGCSFQTILSFEFTLNQNWALAIDNVYTHFNKTRFRGKQGTAPTGRPSSEQWSFAPAIEYNFSYNFGIIAGAWVTGFGRNSAQFRSGVVAVNLYF